MLIFIIPPCRGQVPHAGGPEHLLCLTTGDRRGHQAQHRIRADRFDSTANTRRASSSRSKTKAASSAKRTSNARPRSRGWLRLAAPDIHVAPDIQLNYFSDPDGYDERTLIAGLRYAIDILACTPLLPYIKAEIQPGPDVVTNEDFGAYVRETCETVYHPSGTCKMGAANDPLAVVTPDLRVRGIDGLRVADASVFPSMVTVNICNTVMMVAERAAALIRGTAS